MLEQKRKALHEIQARKSLLARSHWPGLARVSRPTLGTRGNAVKTELGPRLDRDLSRPFTRESTGPTSRRVQLRFDTSSDGNIELAYLVNGTQAFGGLRMTP
jgi:hypothetical protein